ncbi:MAG: thermonuclease family protein [Nitrosopumilus sp.]|nr:MAG: thermonuclease family protein [Nitrosopumilus sp.]
MVKVILVVLFLFTASTIFSVSVIADEGLVPSWIKNTALFYGQGSTSDTEFVNAVEFLLENGIIEMDSEMPVACLGTAACIPGKVTAIADGDTIKVYGKSVRFSLASAPERSDVGGREATKFVESICPVGSSVVVDEDDEQTHGSYGRIIAEVHCNGISLNGAILENGHGYVITEFCKGSEFGDSAWAQKHGC